MKDEKLLKKLALEYTQEAGAVYLLENDALEVTPTVSMDRKVKTARRRQWLATHRRAVVSVAASIIMLVVVGAALLPGFLRGDYSFTEDFAMPQADAPAPTAAPTVPPMAETAVDYDLWAQTEMDEEWYFTVAEDAALPSAEEVERAMESTANDDVRLNQQPSAPAEPTAPENDGTFNLWGMREAESTEEEPPIETTGVAPMLPSPGVLDDAAVVILLPPTGWRTVYSSIEGDMSVYHFENAAGNFVSATIVPQEDLDFTGFTPVQINEATAYLRVESSYSVLVYRQGDKQFTLTTTNNYEELIRLAQYWN